MRERLAQPTVGWESRTASLAVHPASLEIEDPTEPARTLDSLLIAPVRGDLTGITTLIVSPSGPLRYVPFAALYDGREFLLDRFEVVVLTRAGTLESPAALDAAAPLLAFGNPDGTLPGAEEEVRALAAMWTPAPVVDRFGATATKALLREEVKGCRVLHLATHGALLAENPEGSYLVLGGDGPAARLTLRDILLLPLNDVDLAVLSACETAVGDRGEGSEVTGIAYTFEQRGTGSVVATLWKVNDRSTADLMTAFYGNLRAGGMTRARALREAQLALRRNPEYTHPYFWAPFLLIGNWR
jgi:CHAT domain-containing protein